MIVCPRCDGTGRYLRFGCPEGGKCCLCNGTGDADVDNMTREEVKSALAAQGIDTNASMAKVNRALLERAEKFIKDSGLWDAYLDS